MGKYTIGLAAITLGAVASDGDVGTTLAALGQTFEDSCKLSQEDATTTDFYAEEQDAAAYSFSKAGKTSLSFQIMNPDTTTLVALFGGTASGSSPTKKWNAPATTPILEQTVKVVPQVGMTFIIPRGLVSAKLNGTFGRKNLFLIDVKVDVLTPTKSGVGALQFIE